MESSEEILAHFDQLDEKQETNEQLVSFKFLLPDRHESVAGRLSGFRYPQS